MTVSHASNVDSISDDVKGTDAWSNNVRWISKEDAAPAAASPAEELIEGDWFWGYKEHTFGSSRLLNDDSGPKQTAIIEFYIDKTAEPVVRNCYFYEI
jgi:hypothetical protein